MVADEQTPIPQGQDLNDPSAATDTGPGLAQEVEPASESFFESLVKGQDTPPTSSMLFMAGVLIAMIVMMRSLMRSSAKRKMQTRTMGDPHERIEKINERATGSMEPARQVMVEAEDLTRRMGAVLDNKATKIEILLEEATARIAELERANRELPQPAKPQSLEQPDQHGVCPEALDRARLDQDREERTWVGDEESGSAHSVPTFRIDRGLRDKSRDESPHPLTFPEQVDELATQGLNALEIANKLNRLVGEVELVLNLRRNSG